MRRFAFVVGTAAVLALMLAIGGPAYAGAVKKPVTYYVNDDAAGTNDGTSWKNAFTDLQSALAVAVAGDSVWVAAGTYKPSVSLDGSADARTAAFSLKSGVALYGGFVGVERQLAQRSPDPALTVLSGDIGVAGDATDNSYHVVYASEVTGAVFDGFTVTAGQGDRFTGAWELRQRDSRGAGMYNYASALTVADCVFSDNRVDGVTTFSIAAGGGMYNEQSAPVVTNCAFRSNWAGGAFGTLSWGQGGGMYNSGTYGSYPDESWPSISGCTFDENFAYCRDIGDGGGGMFNDTGSATIDGCTFTQNSAGHGGAMVNYLTEAVITNCVFVANFTTYSGGRGGAIFNMAVTDILNCTFYKNGWRLMPSGPEPRFRPYTQTGGAINCYRAAGTITNCIFSDNAVRSEGGGVAYNVPRGGTLTNCLFFNNIRWQPNYDAPEISHVSGVSFPGFTELDNLYDVDPLLASPVAGDFHLQYDSPCIDAGETLKHGNLIWPWTLPVVDFDGDKRIVDGDCDGAPMADIGADEYVPDLPGLRAFITALVDDGVIDATLADTLLAHVDAASEALARDDDAAAIAALKDLIADVKKYLGATETALLIETRASAVSEEI